MARFKRARKKVSAFYKKSRRVGAKRGGLLNDVFAGAVVGGVVTFGAPIINQYVPSVGPVQPVPLTLAVGGAAGKYLHIGGKFADAALIIGVASIVSSIAGGMGVSSAGGGGAYG